MELAGRGALMAMLEERKKRLAAAGLFDAARKKAIPFLPRVVGVITSPTGAVIRDIMHRLADRCPRHVVLWPVNVQGERASGEISAAIRGFNALQPGGVVPRPDVLIVARGGGSFEDLLVFSEENVVRATAESLIPIISAVGHETDTTLIDFASDRRAPTPTAAAEMAVPVLRDLVGAILELDGRLFRGSARGMDNRRRALQGLVRALPRADAVLALARQRFDGAAERLRGALFQNLQRHQTHFSKARALLRPRLIASDLAVRTERLGRLETRLGRAYGHHVQGAATALAVSTRVLESVSYRAVLARGFTLIRGDDGRVRRRAASLRPGEPVSLRFSDGEIGATVDGGSDGKPPRRMGKSKPTQGDLF